jgi:hypothetical protein
MTKATKVKVVKVIAYLERMGGDFDNFTIGDDDVISFGVTHITRWTANSLLRTFTRDFGANYFYSKGWNPNSNSYRYEQLYYMFFQR